MAFSEHVSQALAAKLSEKHIRTRRQDGVTLAYIEGWHAIAEANRIFGYDAWDRETILLKCVSEDRLDGVHRSAYLAKVRVTVRAGDMAICREGTGVGHGTGVRSGDAHESAAKEAETDAMKRALATFGNPFGLALYDRDRKGVRKSPRHGGRGEGNSSAEWTVFSEDREKDCAYSKPTEYLGALRRGIDARTRAEQIARFIDANTDGLTRLAEKCHELRNGSGEHYVDTLLRYARHKAGQLDAITDPDVATSGEIRSSAQINGNNAPIPKSEYRRRRDRAHLKYIASLPCIVCGRTPSHAHHIRYVQPRAMSQKVSDEWTVPLCNLHHRALHDAGKEEDWWSAQKIEPVKIAKDLWDKHLTS